MTKGVRAMLPKRKSQRPESFGNNGPGGARVVKESSDSGVKLEQATESVATANGLGLRRYVRRRKEKKIAFALVVPFQVMMIDVLVQRPA